MTVRNRFSLGKSYHYHAEGVGKRVCRRWEDSGRARAAYVTDLFGFVTEQIGENSFRVLRNESTRSLVTPETPENKDGPPKIECFDFSQEDCHKNSEMPLCSTVCHCVILKELCQVHKGKRYFEFEVDRRLYPA